MADNKRARTDVQQGSQKYSVNPEFLRFLIHSKVEQLQPSNGIVYVAQREENIVDVWKGLIRYQFTSCPVLQKTKSKWYGFIDLADITEAIVQIFGRQKLETTEDFWEALGKDEMFIRKQVKDIMAYPVSRRNPFHPVLKGYSLFSAIEILSREHELHRIPVLEDMKNRRLVNVITQSQIIDFLAKNIDMLGTIRDKPVSHINSAHHKVIRIQATEVAMEAFKLMHYNEVSGIAVIDADGKLIGAVTTNDLKLIHADATMFKRLYQPIKDFMKNSLKEETLRPRHLVVAKEGDSMEMVIKSMDKNRVHRVFVVDDHKKPIGVIAMQDILAEIIKSV